MLFQAEDKYWLSEWNIHMKEIWVLNGHSIPSFVFFLLKKMSLTQFSWIFFSLQRVGEKSWPMDKGSSRGWYCRGGQEGSGQQAAQFSQPGWQDVAASHHYATQSGCCTPYHEAAFLLNLALHLQVLVCLSFGAVKVQLTQKRLGYTIQNHRFNNKSKSLKITRPRENIRIYTLWSLMLVLELRADFVAVKAEK